MTEISTHLLLCKCIFFPSILIYENFRGRGHTPGTPFLESAPAVEYCQMYTRDMNDNSVWMLWGKLSH